MCSSISGLFSGQSSARYMSTSITIPDSAPTFTYLFNISERPIPRSPHINNQSTTPTPASPVKNSANGPLTACVRNPVVGDPP